MSVNIDEGCNVRDLLKAVFAATFIFLSMIKMAVAENAYEGGSFIVSAMRVGSGGTYVEFQPPLAGCNGGSQYRMHARIRPDDTQNYDAIVSTLLSAYHTKSTLRGVWYETLPDGVSECNNAGGILRLYMVKGDWY